MAGTDDVATPTTFASVVAARAPESRRKLQVLSAIAVAAALCGFWVHPNGYIWLAAAITALAFGLVWPWVSLAGLTAEVSASSDRVEEGQPLSLTLTVHNRWPWAAWDILLLAEGLSADVAADAASPVLLEVVPGRGKVRYKWTITPRRRGVYPQRPAQLLCRFPFSLTTAHKCIRASQWLVWPQVFPVRLPMAAGRRAVSASTAAPLGSGEHGDTTGVRPFRSGDTLRRVHWAQTARHDRLIVRDRQPPAAVPARLLLDLADTPTVDPGDSPDAAAEWAIRAFASLAVAWSKLPGGVVACLAGRTIPLPAASNKALLLDELATLDGGAVIAASPQPGDCVVTTRAPGADAESTPLALRFCVGNFEASSHGTSLTCLPREVPAVLAGQEVPVGHRH
jgi:uncharacterized protein (DUF58 family)